jgi:hypothetical protein
MHQRVIPLPAIVRDDEGSENTSIQTRKAAGRTAPAALVGASQDLAVSVHYYAINCLNTARVGEIHKHGSSRFDREPGYLSVAA